MTHENSRPLCVVVLSVDTGRYALPIADLIEILPLMALKQVPLTPEWVAGLMNYRSDPVVVVDISLLMTGKPCRELLTTRILLASVRRRDGTRKALGLMVEGVTETMKIMPENLRSADIRNENAPYLGLLALHDGEMLQIIHADNVLTEESRMLLELENKE